MEGIYSEEYDPKAADIWTCGVMLYVFTTACLPFDSENNATLYRLIKAASFQWPRNVTVSAGAKQLVSKILDANPATRPKIEDIKNDLWFMVNFTPITGKEEKERTPRAPPKEKKSMNAFELLSKMESVAKMGAAGGEQMCFTAKVEDDNIKIVEMVCQKIGLLGYEFCVDPFDNTKAVPCEGHGLKFSFEAQTIIDKVFVVVFQYKQGDQDLLYNLYVDVAAAINKTPSIQVQGKLPVRKGATASSLEADLDRVASGT